MYVIGLAPNGSTLRLDQTRPDQFWDQNSLLTKIWAGSGGSKTPPGFIFELDPFGDGCIFVYIFLS